MSGLRYFDDRMHELIALQRKLDLALDKVRKFNSVVRGFAADADVIHNSEMRENRGRISQLAIAAANEKAAALTIIRRLEQ